MSKPVCFITGIAGFVGSYLAEELLAHGYRVCGALYPGEDTGNLDPIREELNLTWLDILDPEKSVAAVASFEPDYIFHLAAISSVGQSFRNERLTFKINIEGTLNMLQAARELSKLKRFVFISSSECYGVFRPKNKTLTEDQPFNPVSPYGITKAAAEQASLFYWREHGLPVTIARSFNHSGPRQAESFVIPAFARQIASIEASLQKPVVKVGDLTPKRDLSDVRDIVRGYRLLAEKGKAGRVYHFCSGQAVTIKSVLDGLLKLSKKKINVQIDKERLRQNDIPMLRGDNSRAVRELGFANKYSLKDTLQDTLNYWREKVTKSKEVPAE